MSDDGSSPERTTRDRLRGITAAAAIRAAPLVGPRPAAALLRRSFAAGGVLTAAALSRHAPAGIAADLGQRYGDEPEALLDVYRPEGSRERLPVLFWVHGGGWFGGSRSEAAGYLRLIAAHGYAAVAADYSPSPRHRYPTPTRQVMQALGYLAAHAHGLGVDPARIVIGGDSAGGHIAAQVAALLTTPGYASLLGIEPALSADALRGVVLACGFFDLALAAEAAPGFGRLLHIELWAHLGRRYYLADPELATMSVTDHVSPGFPPTLITVGNSDALEAHSRLLATRLGDAGAAVETVFYDPGHRPALDHEYQFNLELADARAFLERLLGFLATVTR